MDSALVELYKRVLCNNANMYMSTDGNMIFVTWVEEAKGPFRRTGAGDPGKIKKMGVHMNKAKGTLKKERVI